jgi:hypothetical protein
MSKENALGQSEKTKDWYIAGEHVLSRNLKENDSAGKTGSKEKNEGKHEG